MSNYRRNIISGGWYFFTVVTWQRKPIFSETENINLLRAAFKRVKQKSPFDIDAMVIMPDHLHCIWRLPQNDNDFSGRWREIKKHVSKQIMLNKYQKNSNQNHIKENLIWQRRFWEHTIRSEDDWKKHMDYIHYNPVKHGSVDSPSQWQASSFLKCVEKGPLCQGWYEQDWGLNVPHDVQVMDLE